VCLVELSAIARAVALFTENGDDLRPRAMHTRYAPFKKKGIHLQPGAWDAAFMNQTSANVNVASNGIAKALGLLLEN
jgi:hypothetical protein